MKKPNELSKVDHITTATIHKDIADTDREIKKFQEEISSRVKFIKKLNRILAYRKFRRIKKG